MNKKNLNKVKAEVKAIVQRVLDCTLWDHFPYESINIINYKSFKRKIEVYEELLRQKFKLQKQLAKVDSACDMVIREILKDRNNAVDQNGKQFRSPDACVNARYKVVYDFVEHIMIEIGKCKIDPDTIMNIVLEIPYTIDYNNSHEIMEDCKINDIKDALSDLWFVSSVQPVYDKSLGDGNKKISQFICKCNLRVNEEEETENDPEVGNTDNFSEVEEVKSGEAEQLKKAILYHHIPNTVVADPIKYMESFKHEDVIACTIQIFNELVSIMISEKRLYKAISRLFIHKNYCSNNKSIRHEQLIKEKILQVNEMFLDQVVNAINEGGINGDSTQFCTVIKHDLSKANKEVAGTKYEEIISAFKELWFVKDVYPHYGLDGIDNVMIVCKVPINKGAE